MTATRRASTRVRRREACRGVMRWSATGGLSLTQVVAQRAADQPQGVEPVAARRMTGQRGRVDAFLAGDFFAGVFSAGAFFAAVLAPDVTGSLSRDRPLHSAWRLSSIAD